VIFIHKLSINGNLAAGQFLLSCLAVILLHVGEGVVLRGVAVGPGEHRVGLAERAGTLPLECGGSFEGFCLLLGRGHGHHLEHGPLLLHHQLPHHAAHVLRRGGGW